MTGCFLALESALYALFLWRDLSGVDAAAIKYGAIALCLLFSLLYARRGGSRLMPAAMALTLAADTFLLLLDAHYGVGVALFCGVQGLYLLRLLQENGGRSLWLLRLGLTLPAWAALGLLGLLTPLNALAGLYFVNFLVNACQALGRREKLFALGLWLYLLCDVCVGIWNQPSLFPAALSGFARVGMWLFYLPGQVLLVLSGRKREEKDP